MSVKKILIGAALVGVCAVGGYVGIVYAIRQWPVSVPANPVAMKAAALGVVQAKCADCHDATRPEVALMKVPILGTQLREHRRQGIRHWDIFDCSWLGAKATEAEKKAAAIPQGPLVKLDKVVADGSMPPANYRFAHWGTSLSASEKNLLATWTRQERTTFLATFGIAIGSDDLVQPIPRAIPTDATKVELGRLLYNDKRLSTDNTIACATCHDLKRGATDNQPVSTGVGGKKGGVNAPTAFNAVFNMRQFWDGRAATLAEQAGGPPLNPVEMASRDWNEICGKLAADENLSAKFCACWPEGFNEKTICASIAEYEKTLLTPDSRFDRFLAGEAKALTELEKVGWNTFRRQACTSCHAGPALGGQSFEYIDLKKDYFKGRAKTEGDAGLSAFSKNPKDFGRFKVPTLRNVALTAPYFHDARQKTLTEAVQAMFTYCLGKEYCEAEVVAIVSFLQTLTGIREDDSTPVINSHWKGKKVAFLGDSITDPRQKNRIFWQFLAERMGIKPLVYAVSGYRWGHMPAMAEKLKKDTQGDVDAILVFIGTNDFNGSVPPGVWWTVSDEEVNRNGTQVRVKKRTLVKNLDTVRGAANATLSYLKANFPQAEIILITPLHRGYANFSERNVQPDESYANARGLWIDDYVKITREASDIWSVPVIDFFAEAQLWPNDPAFVDCFRDNGGNDLLHPNTRGHERLAELVMCRLMMLPAGYR